MLDIDHVQAYWMYTVDKLISNISKQLVQIVTDKNCTRLTALYTREMGDSTSELPVLAREASYRFRADHLVDEDENLYKIDFVSRDRHIMVLTARRRWRSARWL